MASRFFTALAALSVGLAAGGGSATALADTGDGGTNLSVSSRLEADSGDGNLGYVAPGERVTFKVVVENWLGDGDRDAQAVQVVDKLAPGFENLQVHATDFDCSISPAAAPTGGSVVACERQTVRLGETHWIEISATAKAAATGDFTNKVSAKTATPVNNPEFLTHELTGTFVDWNADLAITCQPQGPVIAGSHARFRTTITNLGPQTARRITTDVWTSVEHNSYTWRYDNYPKNVSVDEYLTITDLAPKQSVSFDTVFLVARDAAERGELEGFVAPRTRDGNQANNACNIPLTVSQPVTGVVDRQGGSNRYATAIALTQSAFPAGNDTVYLASGEDYPDALAGAAVAGKLTAPLLLSPTNTLPGKVANELLRLAPKRIVLLGGTGALSDALAAQLTQLRPAAEITRIAGADRFATAAQLATTTYSSGAPSIYLANGLDFPDALAAAAAAGDASSPVLLTAPGRLSESTRAAIASLRPARIVVVGGAGAVSPAVVAAAEQAGGVRAVRYGGANRFETARLLATAAFHPRAQRIVVANAFDYPDALVGAGIAAMAHSPVLLTSADTLPSDTRTALQTLQPERVSVAGGPAVVSEAVRAALGEVTGLRLAAQ